MPMTDPMPDTSLPASGRWFPIRTVAGITGVHPVTLRAWERRYHLLQPRRTPKGHRLYSQADIDRIHRVVGLLAEGISISQAATLVETECRDRDTSQPDPWRPYLDRMLGAITRFDEPALDATYNDALALYPVDIVSDRLIAPLLHVIGERWANHTGDVAEEHFFSAYLRNKLGARLHHQGRGGARAQLIAACLPEERHDFGLLLFCLSAASHGYRVVLLGADMPLAELPGAAQRSRSDAIVLSVVTDPTPDLVNNRLPELVHAARVPVFLGGRAATRHAAAIAAAGAACLGANIPEALVRLNRALPGAPGGGGNIS
jgi:DNA-binding transcriptional MerR regulator/methylmalonyl-CoA mutase cobalamin-binding subunit